MKKLLLVSAFGLLVAMNGAVDAAAAALPLTAVEQRTMLAYVQAIKLAVTKPTAGIAQRIGAGIGGTTGWVADLVLSTTKSVASWGWWSTKGLVKYGVATPVYYGGKYLVAKPVQLLGKGVKKLLWNKKAAIILGTLAIVIATLEGLNRYNMLPDTKTNLWVGWDIDGKWDTTVEFVGKQAGCVQDAYEAMPTQQGMIDSLNIWYNELTKLPQAAWDRDTLWTNSIWEKVSGMYTEIANWVRAISSQKFRDAPGVVEAQAGTIKHLNAKLASITESLTAEAQAAKDTLLAICKNWNTLWVTAGNGNKAFIQQTCAEVLCAGDATTCAAKP